MALLPLGVQLSSNVIAGVQSEGTILKISIKVSGAIMDPKQFLCFPRKGVYRTLSNGNLCKLVSKFLGP